MIFYIGRRLVSAISVVFVALIFSFCLFYVAPSDPAGAICGARCTPERVAEIKHSLNLDQPKAEQLVDYLDGIVVGHTYHQDGVTTRCNAPCLGYSYSLDEPVTSMVARAAPVTVSIVLGAAVFFLSLGLLTGIVAARMRGSALDRIMIVGSQGLGAIPYFVFALLISLYVTILPESSYTSLFDSPAKWFSGLILAWLCLGFYSAGLYTRYVRASMIESLSEDYVRTARAKGISERKIIFKHALRATLTPIATIFGVDLATQLTGAIFTESIFQLPGLGLLTLQAFGRYDLPVLMATVIFGATVLVTLNLLVDIAYTYLDPRVRLS